MFYFEVVVVVQLAQWSLASQFVHYQIKEGEYLQNVDQWYRECVTWVYGRKVERERSTVKIPMSMEY